MAESSTTSNSFFSEASTLFAQILADIELGKVVAFQLKTLHEPESGPNNVSLVGSSYASTDVLSHARLMRIISQPTITVTLDPLGDEPSYDSEIRRVLTDLVSYANQLKLEALRVQYLHEDGTTETHDLARTPEFAQKLAVRLGIPDFDVAGYECLQRVLVRAYHQAASGKGAQRHASGMPFDEQPMQTIQQLVGTGFATGQAMKKLQEASRMEPTSAVRELLGAINYIAGTIIFIENSQKK